MKTLIGMLGKSNKRRIRWPVMAILIMTTSLALAQDRLCFIETGNSYSSPPSPTVDGVVDNDDGWLLSNQYVFGNGTTSPDAVVQMRKKGSALFLSFEINNDPSFDDNDVIVLVVAPVPGTSSTHRRIHIYPVVPGVGADTAAPGSNPSNVDYWTDSSTWNSSVGESRPTWLQDPSGNIKVTSSSPAVPQKSYVVEMKIPISADPDSGVDIPTTGEFGLYFNILRVTESGGSSVVLGELHWPESASDIGGTIPAVAQLTTNTPDSSEWGDGTLVGPCPGVRVTDVYTNHPTIPNRINADSTNVIMSVELENNSLDSASDVSAIIRSTRFGTAGADSEYGVVPGSPTNAIGLAAGVTGSVNTSPWDVLNDPRRSEYLAWPNVCSKVELNATGGLIGNKYYYWNLQMGTASKFEHRATINTYGMGLPAGGRDVHEIELYTSSNWKNLDKAQIACVDDQSVFDRTAKGLPIRGETLFDRTGGVNYKVAARRYFPEIVQRNDQEMLSMLSYRVHPYLHTDAYIVINGERYAIRESWPGWEYLLAHDGLVGDWNISMPDIPPVQGEHDVLKISAAQNSQQFVSMRANAIEGKKPRRCFDWSGWFRK